MKICYNFCMKDFTHLHLHTEYSLLDGAVRIKSLMEKISNLGMKSVAITDHGVMYGVINFYQEALKYNIKPIIGCEVYTAKRSRLDKEYNFDATSGHLVLLAKNMIGYKNLIKIVSKSFTEGFYYKPRIDYELLKEHAEGLICLSACLSGDIPNYILNNDFERAKELANQLKNMFPKDHFYLELQDNGIQEQNLVNQKLIEISKQFDIPLVATNDVHYLNKEDSKVHDVLLCIQTGKTVDDTDRMKFSSDQFYLRTQDEMYDIFSYVEEALSNTVKISDMCELDFEFNKLKLPEFKIENISDHEEYLKDLVYTGLKYRYKNTIDKLYYDRVDYELKTISELGYIDYFLIVNDFIQYAKDNDIMVGPGRGSAAGSLVSYCLGITNIDPIKYGLIFERFLNKERITMPDIDIDFCYEKRQQVIEYVKQKYGEDRVSQIITFGTMGARGSIRDVGRALNISFAETDKIAKMIPQTLGITIKKALEINKELQIVYDNDESIEKLIDTAILLEGISRHSSTHAAGVVITKDPVSDYVPLQLNDDNTVTQFPMETLESLGILKMDFLGLRTLTVIKDCIELVYKMHKKTINLHDMQFEDKNVFELISKGETIGIFQLESPGMTSFMKDLKPNNLEDIIAGISLYRPGPMDQIPKYLLNKKDSSSIAYHHELLKPILDVTYGCMIYQEQVISIVRELADYSIAHADIVRRAMSKKKTKVMEKERIIFVKGAKKKGVSEKISNAIFDEMMDFASYAFNKSHAAAYAVIAYQTAFLKFYYPVLFMASSLNSFLSKTDKVTHYIRECEKMKISIFPPNINFSLSKFSVEKSNIRFGLSAIKNVGAKIANDICIERDTNGIYLDFLDFCKRITKLDVNKKCVESLIKAGCFDIFNENRRQLVASFEKLLDSINNEQKRNIKGQISLFKTSDKAFNSFNYPNLPEFESNILLSMEKEMLGLYITGNPLKQFEKILKEKVTFYSKDKIIDETYDGKTLYDGKQIVVAGIINKISKKITKNNSMMAFVQLEDLYGSLEIIVFPKTYENSKNLLIEDSKVIIEGKLTIREDEEIKIICQVIKPLIKIESQIIDNNFNNKKIYINADAIDEKKLISFLLYFNGNTSILLRKTINKKKITQKVPNNMNFNFNDTTYELLIEEFGKSNIIIKNI